MSPIPDPSAEPPGTRWTLLNLTVRRIGIDVRGSAHRLVLPPLGSRRVPPGEMEALELEPWLSARLVRALGPPARGRSRLVTAALGVTAPLLLVGLPLALAVAPLGGSAPFWGVLAGVMALLLGVGAMGFARAREHARRILQGFRRVVGLAMVAVIGFGVPALMLWALRTDMGGIRALDRPAGEPAASSLALMGIFLFVAFIGIVSVLPALMYFLFEHQQTSSVRRAFFRDLLRLDPALRTAEDARATYGPLLRDVNGSSRPGLRLSGVPVLVSTLMITMGWTVTLLPTIEQVAERIHPLRSLALHTFLVPHATPASYAFMGVYFFTLNMVFRRYVRADLGPKAYSHITVRMIIAMVLAWAVGTMVQAAPAVPDAAEPAAAAYLLVLCFFVGIVPETGLALIHDFLQRRHGVAGRLFPSLREQDPLSELEGITLYDRARLLEEGIENIENLAHHNLVELMVRTRIPTPRLVDLADQAILFLHVRDQPREDQAGVTRTSLATLRGLGVRTATDLESAVAATAGDPAREAALMGLLGEENGVQRLRVILDTMQDDEWMAYLRNWRSFRRDAERIHTAADFGLHPAEEPPVSASSAPTLRIASPVPA